MCGIIAVLRRRSERPLPEGAEVLAHLDAAIGALSAAVPSIADVAAAADSLEHAERLLRGVPGVMALIDDPGLVADLDERSEGLWTVIAAIDAALDGGVRSGAEIEQTNAGLLRVRDALWSIQRDRLRTARLVSELAGPAPGPAAIEAYTSIQVALSALDRLEVRGRDSAGLHL